MACTSTVTLKEINLNSAEYPTLEHIYDTEFPPAERFASFHDIVERAIPGKVNISAICDQGQAVGFCIRIIGEAWQYLMFFGIDGTMQGHGYGEKALKVMMQETGGVPLVFCIESTEVEAANSEQRIRRKNFYLRQGMHDTGIRFESMGVPFEVMASVEKLDPAFFDTIIACLKSMKR